MMSEKLRGRYRKISAERAAGYGKLPEMEMNRPKAPADIKSFDLLFWYGSRFNPVGGFINGIHADLLQNFIIDKRVQVFA